MFRSFVWIHVLAVVACATPLYELTQVPSIYGFETKPYAINSAGQVAGVTYRADGTWSAFTYSGGVSQLVPQVAGATYSEARGISDNGYIGGWYTTPTGTHAYIINPANQLVDLAGVVADYSLGLAMNRFGVLAGHGDRPNSNDAVFVYDPATGTTTWIPNQGGDFGWTEGINSNAAVRGISARRTGRRARSPHSISAAAY